ncbi:hypothetical protein HOY80DRAFT_1036181 [Tuber brumale]|nr:hypothetical protein HOY80DRAFT_1036181 [Tuber brumale]
MVRPSLLPALALLSHIGICSADDSKVIHTKVLILGGGMAGVTAARTLAQDLNVTDFLIVEARGELGGRVQNTMIGNTSIEFGANWIQGLGRNPIWELAQKYEVKNRLSVWSNIDYYTESGWEGEDGPLKAAMDKYEEEIFPLASADAGRRVALGLPDLSMKAGLRVNGWAPMTPEERAAEYFSHDWEYAEPPIYSSFIECVNSYNESFIESSSSDNNLVIDPRGYKTVIIKQAEEIPSHQPKIMLNQVIETITYTSTGVTVTTKSGHTIHAEYALCTFSLGVLQHDDVKFVPPLPDWKREAYAQFHMATYTKIFARFPTKFWNDTELSVYADSDDRGYYTVWQSLDAEGFYPGSKILFATLTSEHAYRAELQTDAETLAEFVGVLETMYGKGNVPQPLEFKYPRWTLDPLFRGSFTNWGAGVTVKQQEDMRAAIGGDMNPEKRLFFAGEHTSRKYFGYLHGAYWEGRMAAHRISDCIKHGCEESSGTTFVKRHATELEIHQVGKRVGRLRRRMWA